MKRNDVKALHTKSEGELQKQIKEAKEKLFTMKLDFRQNKLKNTSSLSTLRADIAKLMTILKEKEEAQWQKS